MKVELKTWGALGLATALAGAGLAGCSGEAGEGGEAAPTTQSGESGSGEAGVGEGGEGEGGEGEGGESGGLGPLPVEQRLVFMAGHVEAGIALYRAGEAQMAAPHLLHPVSETHADERAGLDALGFDPAPFEQVSAALEAGEDASTVEPQLAAAQSNLATMRDTAQGDAAAQIRFLMETAAQEYAIAVPENTVTDAAEYQDAWGFVLVARQIAETLDAPKGDAIRAALDDMLALWPEGAPIPPASPASAGQVSALASRVQLDLPR